VAYAYRASTSAGNASGGALSINKPAGTVDGDLLVAVLYLESDTNTWTPPAGWNTSAALTQDNTGSLQMQVFWKIASGEGASWSWTPGTNNWRSGVVAAYSGGSGSGERVDIAGGSQGDAISPVTNQTAPSVSTTVVDDLLVFGYGNFSGTNVTAMTGTASNLRVSFGGCTIADANRASTGATGTSAPSSGPGSDTYAALHAAFLLAPGGAAATSFLIPPPRMPLALLAR
jgi:hypothetical protein